MKKPSVLVLILLLCAGVFFASPFLAARGLAQALRTGDKAALEARVDFPALRDNLRQQVQQAMAAQMRADADNPFAAMAAAFMSALVAPLVDALVTPEGLARLIEYDRQQRQGDAPDPFAAARMRFAAFDEFRISLPLENEQEVHLVLLRKGLDWRLSRIDVPLDALVPEPPQPQEDEPTGQDEQPTFTLPETAGEDADAAQADAELRAEWQRQADALVTAQDAGADHDDIPVADDSDTPR